MSLRFTFAESITTTTRPGTTAVSLGKRKKSIDELNNNNSSLTATPVEEEGLNVDDSGDEGSLSRGEAQRKKKARTTFTGRQIFELEKQFELKKYLSSSERADMAKLLNVTETQVCATLFVGTSQGGSASPSGREMMRYGPIIILWRSINQWSLVVLISAVSLPVH